MKKRHKKRYRIANKRRFITFCTVCMLIILCVFNLINASAVKNRETITISVASGDTLWSIASEANTSGKDVRNVINDIMVLNNLSGSNITKGQSLIVPVY